MIWCEHCKDHFSENHFLDGKCAVGIEYGPTGISMIAEQLLRKIFWECDYIDFSDGRLVLDGSLEITPEETAWIRAYGKEMEPVREAESLIFWERAISDRIKLALAGNTEARERLSYFAHQKSEPARRLAREALVAHGLEEFND